MKVFVAGASGALGAQLVPELVAAGHEVVAMTRTASKQDRLASGARPVVADALDPDAVARVVGEAEPEVIVHQLTALSGKMTIRGAAAPRTLPDGDDDESAAHGGDGPSLGRWPRRGGTALRGAELRSVPLRPHGRASADRGRSARSRPAGCDASGGAGIAPSGDGGDVDQWGEAGLALRYGGFYGPGTGISMDPEAAMAGPVRKRRFPIIGDGGGVWSHIHIEDAAAATAIAVERGDPGVYYIVDDEPTPVREWLRALASALDAPPPRRIPRWLGRLVAGEMATLMMTEVRGASNAKPSVSSIGSSDTRAGGWA